jgi:DNA-binding response OmpR family regulator
MACPLLYISIAAGLVRAWFAFMATHSQGHRDADINRPIQRDTILVVDDEFEIRFLLKVFLEKAGYIVATAADGEEAFSFFKQHQSSIAMLLTDVRMPNMNGIDLADRVLELDSQVPILFMSGETWNFGHDLGCIVKPFNSVELVTRVNRVVGAPGERPKKQPEP